MTLELSEAHGCKVVTIVSGLPRSGTSIMMQMLEAGGITLLVDEIRKADADNPRGYYEFQRVKRLEEGDYDWLTEADGKAVKVISALLEHLPGTYHYRVILMTRRMEEILASQKKMLARRKEPVDAISDEKMARLFHKHFREVEAWLQAQPNVSVLNVDYNELVTEPRRHALRVNEFLGGSLDVDKMVGVVDPELYRNRAG
jgi:hypothetical protein